MDLSQALQIVSRSDAGMVRSHNEDSIFVDAPHGLVILADGMGGYNAGEVASGMATSLLGSELEKFAERQILHGNEHGVQNAALEAVQAEIGRTNAAIYQAAQSQPQYAGMGTTLVLALFYDNAMVVAHIGDSRLYRYRQGKLTTVTRDHSLLQEQIDSGMITAEEARRSQNRNLVTRALGVDPSVEAEVREYDTLEGDIYLLCSDGLNDMVEDTEIEETLEALSGNLELTGSQLVQMANDYGGRDNVSVILVRVVRAFPAALSWRARIRAWLS